MADFYVDLGLSIVFSVLRVVIKNPGKKEEMKKALLKLRNQIELAYAGDPDFE